MLRPVLLLCPLLAPLRLRDQHITSYAVGRKLMARGSTDPVTWQLRLTASSRRALLLCALRLINISPPMLIQCCSGCMGELNGARHDRV
jgi:hypothetical protein